MHHTHQTKIALNFELFTLWFLALILQVQAMTQLRFICIAGRI